MKLYEIEQALEAMIDDETGEIDDLDAFEALEMEREKKIEGILLAIKNLKADAEAIKAEKLALADRQKRAENKAESLTRFIQEYLNGEKFKTAKVAVNYRRVAVVDVVDVYKLPPEFLKVREPEADKQAIKGALRMGATIEGAELGEKISMSIK